VSNDDNTVQAEVVQADGGFAYSYCQAGDWVTDPNRRDSLHDVVEEAGTHMDHAH
jgi:hypothetical protein